MRCLGFGRFLFLGFLATFMLVVQMSASAGFIVNPSGTVLIDQSPSVNNRPEASVQIKSSSAPSLANGFSGQFFGNTVSNIFVSENGNLAFTSRNDSISVPLGSKDVNGFFASAVIAPLWDDYLLDSNLNNRIRADYSAANKYLAVSWENVRLEFDRDAGNNFLDTNRSAQLLWFEGDTTIRGFDFKANDIAFGYVPHSTTGPAFGDTYGVAGLDKGDGTFSAAKGTNDGSLRDNSNPSNLLPNNPLPIDENQFLLFRAGVAGVVPSGFAATDFQGGYYRGTFTLTAVPEPSSLGLCFAAALVTAGAFIRRRWVTAPSSSAMNR